MGVIGRDSEVISQVNFILIFDDSISAVSVFSAVKYFSGKREG